MQTHFPSLRAAALNAPRAALAWAGRTLPALFETAAKTIREDFSHPLTPREEGIVFCGIVMMFLWGVNKMVLTGYEAFMVLKAGAPVLTEFEFDWAAMALMAWSGGAGIVVGVLSTRLWLIGRDIRRRGGLGGKPKPIPAAAVPSPQVQE